MLITDSRSLFCRSCLVSHRNPRKQFVIASPIFAKKRDYSQNSKNSVFPLKLGISSNLLIQSAIGVLALGFIDAGYSGDWSRIGVISRETENLLKAAAFLVTPLCVFLIFSLFKNDGGSEE